MLPLVPHGRADTERHRSADMMRQGQVRRLEGGDATGQSKFVESLFGIAA